MIIGKIKSGANYLLIDMSDHIKIEFIEKGKSCYLSIPATSFKDIMTEEAQKLFLKADIISPLISSDNSKEVKQSPHLS